LKHLAWRVDKFIALHDTTVDGWGGEFVRRFRFEYPTFTPAADKVWRARVAGNLKWISKSMLSHCLATLAWTLGF
jgi:hypothetical protein